MPWETSTSTGSLPAWGKVCASAAWLLSLEGQRKAAKPWGRTVRSAIPYGVCLAAVDPWPARPRVLVPLCIGRRRRVCAIATSMPS